MGRANDDREACFGLKDLFGESPVLDYADLDLTPFRELPPALWSESLLRINEGVNLYVDLQIHGVLIGQGVSPGDPVSPGRLLAAGHGVAASRRATWDWLVAKVARAPAVVETARAGAPDVPLLKALPAGLALELGVRLLEAEPGLEAALELIDVAAAAYPAFLRGDISGEDVLFRSENSSLWEKYFSNTNSLYAPVNHLAAFVACGLLAGRGDGNVSLLEIGAGCGSASEALLEAVARDTGLGARISYRVTDVAPAFLREARERVERVLASLRAANSRPTPEVAYGLLDLNETRERWRVDEHSVDLVLAVNVLHTVRDIEASLHGIHRVLRPGGRLLLGECVRPAPGRGVHPEFVFQLIEAFREVKVTAPHRESWGFLDDVAWRETLGAAGFSNVTFVPDFRAAVAAYPEHTLAAIVAES